MDVGPYPGNYLDFCAFTFALVLPGHMVLRQVAIGVHAQLLLEIYFHILSSVSTMVATNIFEFQITNYWVYIGRFLYMVGNGIILEICMCNVPITQGAHCMIWGFYFSTKNIYTCMLLP